MQNDIWSLSNFTNAQSWVVLIQNNISLKFTLIHFTLLIELKLSMKKINLNWISLDSTAVSIFVVILRRQCCLDYLWRNVITRYICANDTLWEKQVFSHLSILAGKLLSSLPSAIHRQNEKQTDDTLLVNMFFRRKKFNAKSWRKR